MPNFSFLEINFGHNKYDNLAWPSEVSQILIRKSCHLSTKLLSLMMILIYHGDHNTKYSTFILFCLLLIQDERINSIFFAFITENFWWDFWRNNWRSMFDVVERLLKITLRLSLGKIEPFLKMTTFVLGSFRGKKIVTFHRQV